MKIITVGFCTPKKFNILSWLIKFITKSKASHVYINTPVPEYQTSIIFQASRLKANYKAYDLFLKKERVVEEYNIAVTDKQYETSEKLRVTEAGKLHSK